MYHPKLKTLIPLEELEAEAQRQIWDNLRHDFLLQMAVMPDCHTGYTLPIGGVALLDNVISPEYVGYDIGCGMVCCILPYLAKDLVRGNRFFIFNQIYELIPVGFNSRQIAIDYPAFRSASGNKNLNDKVNARLYVQLGTLGSGNHFIEIGETREGWAAVTIHSGSRNIGHSIASHYMALSKKVDTHLPAGFLDLNSEHGQAYLQDMNFALQYALDNREQMLDTVLLDVLKVLRQEFINENHNHAIVRDGQVLHRKGATPADRDQLGVIPGNMRDGVYITRGLGNEEYLSSASHGAGRTMSRKKAKQAIDLSDFQAAMVSVTARVDETTLDEAPFAYKDLSEVIARQQDVVVEVIDHITPLINIKG